MRRAPTRHPEGKWTGKGQLAIVPVYLAIVPVYLAIVLVYLAIVLVYLAIVLVYLAMSSRSDRLTRGQRPKGELCRV